VNSRGIFSLLAISFATGFMTCLLFRSAIDTFPRRIVSAAVVFVVACVSAVTGAAEYLFSLEYPRWNQIMLPVLATVGVVIAIAASLWRQYSFTVCCVAISLSALVAARALSLPFLSLPLRRWQSAEITEFATISLPYLAFSLFVTFVFRQNYGTRGT
jgi:hypothetical protein